MTNTFKITIAMMAFIQIILLVLVGVYIQDLESQKKQQVTDLYARKDDLLLEQQKIENLISSLDSQIQTETAKQNVLIAQVEKLSSQNLTQIRTTVVQRPAVVIPVQTPTPAPVVTRAS